MYFFLISIWLAADIELQNAAGNLLPGCELHRCPEIYGDERAAQVSWNGNGDVGRWASQPVRIRGVMTDRRAGCLLYDALTQRLQSLPFQGSNLLHRKAHRWRNWRSSSSCCALKEPCFWA